LPATMAGPPNGPRSAKAPSRISSRSPRWRDCSSGPWQEKQFSERIGRTSRAKSTRRSTVWADAALAVLPGQAAAHVSVAQRSVHGSHRLALTITLLWGSRSRSRQDRRSASVQLFPTRRGTRPRRVHCREVEISRLRHAVVAGQAVGGDESVMRAAGRVVLVGLLRSRRRHESADRQCDCRRPAKQRRSSSVQHLLSLAGVFRAARAGSLSLRHVPQSSHYSASVKARMRGSRRVHTRSGGRCRACGTKWAAHCGLVLVDPGSRATPFELQPRSSHRVRRQRDRGLPLARC